DQETPNTLLASFDFGGREIVFEVRGLMTGSEGVPAAPRRGPGAPQTNTPPPPPAPGVMIGNLVYGTEGWMAMSDAGVRIYKGDSSEVVMEEKPERGPGSDSTAAHMENFLAACRSRKVEDLHDPINNAYLSASLCHLANISYRTGRKLNIGPGPKFANDPEANQMLTRKEYRKPYVV
ncbi:MAG: hypothetical protein JO022_04945, partial [Acidobacteriaceae bacterium]|nr:hypothetical protein [Acidobacteriaceae bacterium]